MISEVSLEHVTFLGYLSKVSPYAWMFSVTSIILVFVGWFVTYNNALKIATRSESKSIIDAIAKLLNEITDISVDYWVNKSVSQNDINPFKNNTLKAVRARSTPGSKLFITAIHGKASQTSKYIDFLKDRGLEIDNSIFSDVLVKAMIDCEISFRFNKTYRVGRAQEISSQSVAFMMHMYRNFQDIHPPKKGFFLFKSIEETCYEIDAWYKDLEGR